MTTRVKPPVLWVDDDPDAPCRWGGTLRGAIEKILAGEFEIRYANNKDEALRLVREDTEGDIRLVLLDVQFPGGPECQGQVIARDLGEARRVRFPGNLEKALKFIVLTHVDVNGKKINLGNAGLKIEHIIKDELTALNESEYVKTAASKSRRAWPAAGDDTRAYFKNLTRAIVNDFPNRGLLVEWKPLDRRIHLKAVVGKESSGGAIRVLNAYIKGVSCCFQSPNVPISITPADDAAKAVSNVNGKVRELFHGRVWGILANRDGVTAVIPRKNVKCDDSNAPVELESRMATTAELKRVEQELKRALGAVAKDLDVMRRGLAALIEWKNGIDPAFKKASEWLTKQGEALSRLEKRPPIIAEGGGRKS